MIKIFFIFSFIFFFKSSLISFFYTNYLMYLLFPLEIAGLSLINNNNTLPDSILSHSNTYLRWIIINWIGSYDDYHLLEEIESDDSNNYVIILSWVLAFAFYQIYYIIHCKFIKQEKLTKMNWLMYNLKYLLINYFSFFLWNFLILFTLNETIFWISLINILIFNFVTFWIPGLIFYYIYGEELYYYRTYFSFLIQDYNKKFKYFTISLLGLKALSGLYLLLNHYYPIESKFLLFLFIFIYYMIFKFKRIFKTNKKEFTILSLISLLIITFSIIENYFPITVGFIITKYILTCLYIIILIYYYRKFHHNNEVLTELIEMEEINDMY